MTSIFGNRNWALGVAATVLLCACGTNPVTGKRETAVGLRRPGNPDRRAELCPHAPERRRRLRVLPELTAYVNEVGQKLARPVSDRKLPYEFTVLNSSVPNAWALPGGKIAINRGLLDRTQERSRTGGGAGSRDRARGRAAWCASRRSGASCCRAGWWPRRSARRWAASTTRLRQSGAGRRRGGCAAHHHPLRARGGTGERSLRHAAT